MARFMLPLMYLVSFLSFLLLDSCKNPVTPDNTPTPGRRDYNWVIDTIQIPDGYGMLLNKMWGSSAQDVWAVGDATSPKHSIWHFEGMNWNTTPPSKAITPLAIYGFGKNDVWLGAIDGSFWHYNGDIWSEFSKPKIDSFSNIIPQSMCGTSYDDIYTVGIAYKNNSEDYKGIIMHYDGNKWGQVIIVGVKVIFHQIFYNNATNQYLINALNYETSNGFIFSFNGQEIKEIYMDTTGSGSLNKIGDNIFLSKSQKLYKYENNQFKLYKDFTGTDYAGRAWGRNEIDFFTVNWGGIGHYNGQDLVTIFKKANNNWMPNESIIFEKDYFSIWQDGETKYTISIHGTLK